MQKRAVIHLVSFMTLVIGLSLLCCAGISCYLGDPARVQRAFLLSGLLTAGLSGGVAVLTRGEIRLGRREGFGVVTFGWISVALFGALPYLFSGVIPEVVPALFETVSGFTTTGATVLNQLEAVPRGILFWRALTHWFGGMGVLVLCVAILPFLGVGGMQIYRAEVPGPFKDRLTPQIATTAKLLWGVYLLLTFLQTLLLIVVGRMGGFDAICHAFATVATGGFSTKTASIGHFDSAAVDAIVTVFMFLAGVNFSLHHFALIGRPGRYLKDPEFRAYAWILLGCVLFLSVSIWTSGHGSFARSLRDAAFTGTAILTTTGFCTADFDRWPETARLLLVLMMFAGGCAGSTAGGMKIARLMIVFKKIVREIKLFMRPSAMIRIKVGTKPVEQDLVMHISAFFAVFILTFALASLLMTFYLPDLESAVSSVAASLGNVGPGLGAVGATQNYGAIAPVGQGILIFCMLLGRLELYTVLIVFLPGLWKR